MRGHPRTGRAPRLRPPQPSLRTLLPPLSSPPSCPGFSPGLGIHPHPGQTSSVQHSPRRGVQALDSREPPPAAVCHGICLWTEVAGLPGGPPITEPGSHSVRAGPARVWVPGKLPFPTDAFLRGPHSFLLGCPGAPHSRRPPHHKNVGAVLSPHLPLPGPMGTGSGCGSMCPRPGARAGTERTAPSGQPSRPAFPGPSNALEFVNVCGAAHVSRCGPRQAGALRDRFPCAGRRGPGPGRAPSSCSAVLARGFKTQSS